MAAGSNRECDMPLIFLALVLLLPALTLAAEPLSVSPQPRQLGYPWMPLGRWFAMHADDVALAEAGESKLIFLGDSITEGWETDGLEHWSRHFVPRGAVDFGISGDMTQHLLWRLENGAAGRLDPAAVVMLIGVNNTGFSDEPPSVIARGIRANVDRVEKAFPNADILLLAVFPYGQKADEPSRDVVTGINEAIRPLGERERVTYLDLGPVFLEPDGSLSPDVMPDFLHLSAEGYRRWAEGILPWVDERVPLPNPALASDGKLPHAFTAGWRGEKTCQVLYENVDVRIGQCTFPPGVGHEKHYHDPHWGYTLSGSTLRITDSGGERTLTTEAGMTWSTGERTVHEAVNIGKSTTSYIIVEPR
jgi:beta-glucosidase